MEGQVVIGVHARVIGKHVVHLVEAVRRREVLRLIADMPFAKLHGGVVRLLQKLRNGRRLLVRPLGSPGASTAESDVRIGMRPVMNEARPAVQLAWP